MKNSYILSDYLTNKTSSRHENTAIKVDENSVTLTKRDIEVVSDFLETAKKKNENSDKT